MDPNADVAERLDDRIARYDGTSVADEA